MRSAWILACLSLLLGCDQDFNVTRVQSSLSVTPMITDLGTVPIGAQTPFTLSVANIEGGGCSITGVEVQNQAGTWFTFTGATPVDVEPGGQVSLDFAYTPEETGLHWSSILILSDSSTPQIRVDARAQAAVAAASVYPLILDFGPVPVGGSSTRDVYLVNEGEMDLSLITATPSDAAFSVDTLLPAVVPKAGSTPVTLRYTAATADPISKSIEFALSPTVPMDVVYLRANDCVNGNPLDYDQDGDGYLSCTEDCDDENEDIHPGADEYFDGVDSDCDGLVDEGTDGYDDDGDGFNELEGDCNDANSAVHPRATEDYTNGIDDDCDGTVDSGTIDADGDGWGDDNDCVPDNATIHSGAVELEDGLDNDCDGVIDEGTAAYDDDGDGWSENLGDCDDDDRTIYPGATEMEDWQDNDCDRVVDEGTDHYDDDGDGYTEDGGDCDDANASLSPAAVETRGDGIDQDCDGVRE